MMRQRKVFEMPSSACTRCDFHSYWGGCGVPGGTCLKREVKGVPGHYVGDILVNAGVIPDDWEEQVGLPYD